MKFRRSKNSKPIPVLLDEALRQRIEAISEKMGEPRSTVMRIAMRIGLDGLVKAFEAAKEKSAASIVYPEHAPSAQMLNEPEANSGSGEDLEDQIVKHLEEDLDVKPSPKKRGVRKP